MFFATLTLQFGPFDKRVEDDLSSQLFAFVITRCRNQHFVIFLHLHCFFFDQLRGEMLRGSEVDSNLHIRSTS